MTIPLPTEWNVLLTRPGHQCGELKRLFENHGATVFIQPTIEILPPGDWRDVDLAIQSVSRCDILVFASSNGVSAFFDRAKILFSENFENCTRNLPKIFATGPGTAETLAGYGVTDVQIPNETYDAEGIVKLLASQGIVGKKVMIVRGNRGRDVLPDELRRLGADVRQVTVYQSIDLTEPSQEIASLLQCGKIHWVTVTSSAIGRSLVRMFGDALRQTKLASISPITSQALIECGFPPAVEAGEATMPALVDAVVGFVFKKR